MFSNWNLFIYSLIFYAKSSLCAKYDYRFADINKIIPKLLDLVSRLMPRLRKFVFNAFREDPSLLVQETSLVEKNGLKLKFSVKILCPYS